MAAAGRRLVATRRTNNQIRDVVAELLEVAAATLDRWRGQLAETVERAAVDAGNRYLGRSRELGEQAAVLIPDVPPC
jgi:methylthioribose-1-phosphate isomerase